ncbi:MAG TPA: hypothetical protein VJK54_07895 [Chthoniobacterales bacterium]|nr:hypothetical protein [Chthoniobacterales bacterium]
MKECFDFCAEKNRWLKSNREISFEETVALINSDRLLSIVSHHNQKKYPHQQMYLIDIDDYVYVVPFIRKDKNNVILKTIFKSRKLTKQYLAEKKKD